MSESYWKKFLSDGSVELGTDSMIKDRIASWTKGRQDIVKTVLSFAGQTIEICCSSQKGKICSWQQFDNFIFKPSVGSSTRVSRELRCSVDWSCLVSYKVLDNIHSFTLNNKEGLLTINENNNCLVCSIGIDGKVKYNWS